MRDRLEYRIALEQARVGERFRKRLVYRPGHSFGVKGSAEPVRFARGDRSLEEREQAVPMLEAGALVMGVPAREKRQLTAGERAASRENARRYVRNAATYLAKLAGEAGD